MTENVPTDTEIKAKQDAAYDEYRKAVPEVDQIAAFATPSHLVEQIARACFEGGYMAGMDEGVKLADEILERHGHDD